MELPEIILRRRLTERRLGTDYVGNQFLFLKMKTGFETRGLETRFSNLISQAAQPAQISSGLRPELLD
jgi:hypothetical protein